MLAYKAYNAADTVVSVANTISDVTSGQTSLGDAAKSVATDVVIGATIGKGAANLGKAAANLGKAAKNAVDSVASSKTVKNASGGTFRSSDGRLRNSDGTFAPDGGTKVQSKTNGMHGNTAGDQYAERYKLYDKDGNFLKHGVSQDAGKRYTAGELDDGFVQVVETGPRRKMLDNERYEVERNPGPLNKERWAGSKRDELD